MSEPAVRLRAESIGRQIETGWLWRGLDFEIRAGESVAITGPSGSGKTQLLRVISGLDDANEGCVLFDGTPTSTYPMPKYRARVMFLPQRPAMVEGSVEDNLRIAFRFEQHRKRKLAPDRIMAQLGELGRNQDFMQKHAADLSGGETQIVSLLRALALAPEILLLDEPTASLDETASTGMEALVAKWMRENPKRSVIWTSHNEQQLERVTSRRIELQGRNGN